MDTNKMKIEIWSDVVCPFCYTGKRKLESTIQQIQNAPEIEFIWKSFQLFPGFIAEPGKDFYTVMAETNKMSREQAVNMCNQMTDTAKKEGLVFDFEKMVPANSFNASRLSHYAKHAGLQDKVKEALFAAYFTEGKDINDIKILMQIGHEAGLHIAEVEKVLNSDLYADEVQQDIAEARQKGVTSIPYYVFNSTTAVTGAQDSKVFFEILDKTIADWRADTGAQSCKIGEVCN
jgi:predicted DsbA family dithiol-disulfide isomerase